MVVQISVKYEQSILLDRHPPSIWSVLSKVTVAIDK